MTDKNTKLQLLKGDAKIEAERREAFNDMLALADLPYDEKQLKALSREEQLELLEKSSYRQKYQLLRKSDKFIQLLRALTPSDLYFTMDAGGLPEAADLMLHATPEQMLGVFDLDCWEKDHFEPERQLAWMMVMLETDPERLASRLHVIEYEYLLMFFSEFIRVRRFEWSDLSEEGTNDNELMTVDDEYQFELVNPDDRLHNELTALIQHLYITNHELYKQIMEGMIWELPSNLEEYNLRIRTGRMADNGFPEYLESLSMFSPLNPQAMRKELLEKAPALPVKFAVPPAEKLPALYRQWFKNRSFFNTTLEKLDEDNAGRLRYELSIMGNRAMMASNGYRHIETAEDSLRQMHNYLDIGLAYLSERNEERAITLLEKVPLIDIFRAAYSLVMQLHDSVMRFLRKYATDGNVSAMQLVPSATTGLLLALVKIPPYFYEGITASGVEYREFRSLEEIERSSILVDRISFLFDLHFSRLALDYREICNGQYSFDIEGGHEDVHFVKLFMTAFANFKLASGCEYKPLSAENFDRIIKEWLRPGGTGYDVDSRLADESRQWLISFCGESSEEYRLLASNWVARCFQAFDAITAQLQNLEKSQTVALSQIFLLE